MPGDKFVPACHHYVGDAMLNLHPHGEDSGALASSIVWLACACQGCPKNCVWRCAPVVRFAAPPLTGTGEPKTWLVRLLRRDCWPEFLKIQHVFIGLGILDLINRCKQAGMPAPDGPNPVVTPQVTPQVKTVNPHAKTTGSIIKSRQTIIRGKY